MTPSDRIRIRFDTRLREIEMDLIRMGNLVLEMIEIATRIALEEDACLLDQVLEKERLSDEMEQTITERVITTMALEAPVAHDLMLLTATFAVISELEKIGDEATKLAMRVCKLQGEFPYELHDHLREISRQAQANLREGLRLYTEFDAEAADRLVEMDDTVDRMYKVSRNTIIAMIQEHPAKARQLIRTTEIFHALEHVSDHTVDMAKRLKGCYERFGNRSVKES